MGKGQGIFRLEISPGRSTLASQHANHSINIWSMATGDVESTIKYSSKVQAGPRSRMYFIRSHAILSETSSLVAISTSFGNTIEIWNWAKRRRLQVIEHAARWACVQGDVYEANVHVMAVYRAESDRIDLFGVAKDQNAKKMFFESRQIELRSADLPFLPSFPELTYSATSPLLIGAAGPRPGARPDKQQVMLMAWQIDDLQDSHRPYMWVIPDQLELQGALPACLASYGSVAVSIWFAANYRHIKTAKGETKKVPVADAPRYVLVWDLGTNKTRVFPIPNVQSCVSPDCRLIAYCDADAGQFVVIDVASGAPVWAGPDERDLQAGFGWFQQLSDLTRVTEFQFTNDGVYLMVGDQDGGVGLYEVHHGGHGRFGFSPIREMMGDIPWNELQS
jgi:WD40 repeat protein